ncbi:MAG: cytidine deaminase [Myxococcales bacterium]|nr:cytidine deaminase [Myxococcales bacterium]
MDESAWATLKRAAGEARGNAYAPYSSFAVGAAVLSESGRVFTGCNVENASYGATICAERAALSAAVTAGERELVALVIVSGAKSAIPPCGICRQSLAEHGPALAIRSYAGEAQSDYELSALLPEAFGRRHLD